MDLKEFSRRNRERCESPAGFNHGLSSWSLSDWFMATLGELGEAANVGKKLNRVRDGIRELADTLIYLDLLAQSEGIDLADALVETFDAKSEKIGYPQKLGH